MFFSLIIGISPVFAQDTATPAPTIEPTGTFEPLFMTATPGPTRDYKCAPADQTPVGWGIVTPGVLWSADCGNCMLTQTPERTETAYPTSTGTPYTPTPSKTPAPTQIISTATPYPTGLKFTHLARSTTNGTSTGGYFYSRQGQCARLDFYGVVQGNIINRDVYDYIQFKLQRYEGGNVGAYVRTITYSGSDWMDIGGTGGSSHNFSGTYTYNNSAYPDHTFSLQEVSAHTQFVDDYAGPDNFSFTVLACPNGYTMPTETPVYNFPTVTPTNTPVSSYCSSVNGSSGGSGEDWDWGMLPNILIGTAQCVGWEQTSVDLSAINWVPGMDSWEAFDLPAVLFCMKPIYFGSVNLFGINVNYDYLTSLMVGVLVFRMFFRS